MRKNLCSIRLLKYLVVSLVVFIIMVIAVPQGFCKTLKLAHQLPTTFKLHKGMEYFAKAVEEKTDGQIKILIFPAAQLYKGTAITDGVISGSVDIGMNAASYWSGLTPMVGIFDLPFAIQTYDFMGKFSAGEGGKILAESIEQNGVVFLAYCDYGFVQITNNKHPLVKTEDFKGLKIRTYSTYTAQTIQELGGSPVAMSASEAYMGMSRKMIDGVYTGQTSMSHRKYWEVSKYVTYNNITFPEFVLFCNPKVFKSLSDSEKKAFREASAETEDWLRKQCAKEDDKAMKDIENQGMQIHRLTALEKEAWLKKCQPVYDSFITKTGGKNGLGNKLLNIIRESTGQ